MGPTADEMPYQGQLKTPLGSSPGFWPVKRQQQLQINSTGTFTRIADEPSE
jgi:hypothetical protein